MHVPRLAFSSNTDLNIYDPATLQSLSYRRFARHTFEGTISLIKNRAVFYYYSQNSWPLGHTLPMGTHNLDDTQENSEMRFADPNTDTFIPLGKTEENVEKPDVGEVIYAVGNEVRTRRWTWRQSDLGKITPSTKNVFSQLTAL